MSDLNLGVFDARTLMISVSAVVVGQVRTAKIRDFNHCKLSKAKETNLNTKNDWFSAF
jgi:hypothetical protein